MLEYKIRELEKKHEELDRKIQAKEKTGIFEDSNLADLKKQKLAIKDQLSQLRKSAWEQSQIIDMDDDR